MESEGETLVCKVCSKCDPLCSTKLDIPICSACWKSPNIKKSKLFSWSPEIDKINDKLFLGNEEGQKCKNILKSIGITNILVVGSGLEIFHPNDFVYKHVEVDDFYSENISVYFDQTYEFIEKSKGNVFVHCAAGISRSTTIVIAYLMRKESKGFEEVMNYVKERRTSANPNYGFVKQLLQFEEKICAKEKL